MPYAIQRLGHASPVLCPVRALLAHVPLGPRPWLHRLRRRSPGLVRRLRSYCVTPYNFEVLKDGVVIDIQLIHLPHIRFAWPEITRLAKRFRRPGHKIRVKDDAGGIVILTGVEAVRRHAGNED